MGKLKGATLKWKNDFAVKAEAAEDAAFERKRRNSFRDRRASFQKKKEKTTEHSALHIACNCGEALNDARVLQTELAMKLGKLVSLPGDADVIYDANAVAVLLTKSALHDPATLVSAYHAVINGKPLLPVCLIGRGYDHKTAPAQLAALDTSLEADKLRELEALLADEADLEGNVATVESLKATLSSTLPQIIAVNWEPEAGKNQLEAAIVGLVARLKKQLAAAELAKNIAKLKSGASGGDGPNTGRSAASGRTVLSSSRTSPKSSRTSGSPLATSSRSPTRGAKSNGHGNGKSQEPTVLETGTVLEALGTESWQQEFKPLSDNLGNSKRPKRVYDHGPVQV